MRREPEPPRPGKVRPVHRGFREASVSTPHPSVRRAEPRGSALPYPWCSPLHHGAALAPCRYVLVPAVRGCRRLRARALRRLRREAAMGSAARLGAVRRTGRRRARHRTARTPDRLPHFEYNGDPHKTAAGRLGDLVTVGDYGYLDEDGCLFLLARRTERPRRRTTELRRRRRRGPLRLGRRRATDRPRRLRVRRARRAREQRRHPARPHHRLDDRGLPSRTRRPSPPAAWSPRSTAPARIWQTRAATT